MKRRRDEVRRRPPQLAPLEAEVMQILWQRGDCTAEDVQRHLVPRRALTDSSIRTLLRRLEGKKMVAHEKEGRRFVYRPTVARHRVAAEAARHIIDTICGGAVDSLLLGLVENETVTLEELEALRARVEGADDDA